MAHAPAVVLAVDDDRSVLEALMLVLEQDYQVLGATDGASALEVFRSRRVDVVLLDILMPGLDGFAVLERMKSHDALAEIILLTAVMDVSHAVLGMKLGAADYITKPWNDAHLLQQVAAAMRRRRAGAEDVLLVGPGAHLSALQLVLERRVASATCMRASDALASSRRDFKLVLVDSDAPPRDAAPMLRALRKRFAASAFVVLTPDALGARVLADFGELHPWAVVEKPYRLDALLERIGAVVGSRGAGRPACDPFEAPVIRAIRFMTERYRDPLLATDIAKAAGTSPDHLGRLFRDALGLTVKDFFVRLRVYIACRLLKETDQTLDDVAELAGFSDVAYFSRVFVEHAGLRPGLFRRREARL